MWLTHLHRAPERQRRQIFPDPQRGDGRDPLLTEFAAYSHPDSLRQVLK